MTNEKRKFYTMVKTEWVAKNGNILEAGNYVYGVVKGMLTAVCDNETHYGIRVVQNDEGEIIGRIFTVVTTEEKYNLFKEMVEGHYSKLCDFDVRPKK